MNKSLLKRLRVVYAGKRVLVVGLGSRTDGSGTACAKFFLRVGAYVTVCDAKSELALAEQVRHLNAYAKKIHADSRLVVHTGQNDVHDVDTVDIVVQNPAVPDTSLIMERARSLHKEITNDIRLFFDLATNPILAVTGTRGKSTTTALLHAMVQKKYPHARLGGNIGVSPLSFIFDCAPEDPVVLELSSWLLHHCGAVRRGPQVAVFTNLLVDHSNRYSSQDEYIADKANIFSAQMPDDWAIVNRANRITRRVGKQVSARRAWFQHVPFTEENGAFVRGKNIVVRLDGVEEIMGAVASTALRGKHNQENLLAAVMAARCFGIPTKSIAAVIKSFKGLPYRLEQLGVHKGITWWNDSASTTPDATIAALKTFTSLKHVVLICGGESKGVPMKPLNPYIKKVKCALVVSGKGSEELRGGECVVDLKEAVAHARLIVKKGDHILFSPGTTWLPKIDEFKRGDEFKKIFTTLKRTS